MRVRKFFIYGYGILMFLLFAFLTSCGSDNDDKESGAELTLSPYNDYDLEQEAKEPVYITDDLYLLDDIYYTADDEADDEDELCLNLILHNLTGTDITGDFYFELEIHGSDDNWYTIPPTDYFFKDLAVIYSREREEHKNVYKISDINYNFQKGKYRLIREVYSEKYKGHCLLVYNFDL